jgi:transmembrane sensor
MIFNNLCFSDIVSKLERWYNLDIVYDTQSFEKTRITAKFLNNEPVYDVLQVMSIPGAFEFEIESSTIYITKKQEIFDN